MRNAALIIFLLFISTLSLDAQTTAHPLDPLSWEEHWSVLEVLQANGHLNEETRFSMVNLAEPPKAAVKAWSPGKTLPRAAFATVHQGGKAFEAIVDLKAGRLTSWKELEGVQPPFLAQDFGSMMEEIKKNEEFLAAMKRRGIEDLTFIEGIGLPPGYFGTEEQKGRRIAYYNFTEVGRVRNTWPRSIEGLTVIADLNERKILRVVDEGPVPVPTVSADYDEASIGTPREVPGPIHLTQPLGPGFKLDGHQVSWQKWRFHVRPDHRVGMILSEVTYEDGTEKRPVMYEGHLSEIFVPYMDPSYPWYARNFIDAGEFAVGGLSKPLMEGVDCPGHTVYLDALIAGDNGRPVKVPRMIGIFERVPGNPSWRHHAGMDEGGPEGRTSRELVVRHAAVLGNYDYVFDWIFQQDGAIRVMIGSTGIVEVKMVEPAKAELVSLTRGTNGSGIAGDPAADAYGRFVAPQVVAVNHSHYFNFRLDLDVDGTDNSLELDRLQTRMLPEGHPRRSIWVSNPQIAKRESEAKLNMNFQRPTLWRIISNTRKNHVGYPTSYQITPGNNASTLLSADDYPRRRVGFIDHHLWVTPYAANERFAAGDYPTLSTPGQGLPAWTRDDRNIDNTDIVVWHTVGMHHFVRAEDWPVMPVHWQSFMIRPFDFFDKNPALDLPKR